MRQIKSLASTSGQGNSMLYHHYIDPLEATGEKQATFVA
jgi:hypothetical protein